SLGKKARSTIVGAIIFAAVINGALYGLLRLRGSKPIGLPRSASQAQAERYALFSAADAKTAALLIAQGADVNATNEQGHTALMEQARRGNAEVVKVLIKAGANLEIVSKEWKSTALQQALDAEKLDVAQILRDSGAHDVTITERNGKAVGSNSVPLLVVRR